MDGNQLRTIRNRLKWTQVKLAKEVGVTVTTLARWERGEVSIGEPVARLVKMIAKQKGGKKHG